MLIALGGNLPGPLGPPETTLHAALTALEDMDFRLTATSGFLRSPAFPRGGDPDFVNAVAQVETSLSPQDALSRLHEIEADLGRDRHGRWAPRRIDLDLLACGSTVLPDIATFRHWHDLPLDRQKTRVPSGLVLPHPRIQDRAFVLVPVAQIAPDWVHPVLGTTAAQMLAALPAADIAALRPVDADDPAPGGLVNPR